MYIQFYDPVQFGDPIQFDESIQFTTLRADARRTACRAVHCSELLN